MNMSTSPLDVIRSAADLIRVTDYLGGKFFTPGAMRFFNSRVLQDVYPTGDKTGYFVTSERDDSPYTTPSPRAYTVRSYAVVEYTKDNTERRLCERVEIDTVGTFQGYATAAAAKRAARCAANHPSN